MDMAQMRRAVMHGHLGAAEHLLQRLENAESVIAALYFGTANVDQVKHAAEYLVDVAASHGIVLTVRQAPIHPLAMGNFATVVETRNAR